MEEERRLCYVAMTRAKERLYLTCAGQRMLFGRTSSNRPSRFLDEIPPEHLERSGRSFWTTAGEVCPAGPPAMAAMGRGRPREAAARMTSGPSTPGSQPSYGGFVQAMSGRTGEERLPALPPQRPRQPASRRETWCGIRPLARG